MSKYTTFRRFFLERRDDGARFELNGEQGVWLSNPAGLGFSRDYAYADIASGCFYTVEARDTQQAAAFTLTFTDRDPYSAFQHFVEWVGSTTEAYIGYQPRGIGTAIYRRIINIKSISKTEISSAGWLAVSVSLDCLTPWMQAVVLSASHVETSAIWYWSPMAEGHLPAAFELSYTAAAARQVKYLELSYSANGASVVKQIKFATPAPVAAGETLTISTRPDDYRILKSGAAGITDLIGGIDISTDPVLLLPRGVPDGTAVAELVLAVDAYDEADSVSCTMITYYRSV